MAEIGNIRFTKYFFPLLDALRSTAEPMRAAAAVAWIRKQLEIPEEDLTRVVQNGSQTIFENDIHWARFYLVKAGLIDKSKRGLWALTPAGRENRLSLEDIWDLARTRIPQRTSDEKSAQDTPAPGSSDEEDGKSYWFAGAVWNGTDDQLPRFREEGIWQNGYDTQLLDLVRKIAPGDRIAVKASFVKRKNVPFDAGGPADIGDAHQGHRYSSGKQG